MTWVVMPASLARFKPKASALLLITAFISALMLPLAQASMMDCKLLPLPEIKTTMANGGLHVCAILTFQNDCLVIVARVLNCADMPGSFAVTAQAFQCLIH